MPSRRVFKPESVSYEQTERAIAWTPYLASHARIYAPVLPGEYVDGRLSME